jgi:phage major head subunit gpT-like protein
MALITAALLGSINNGLQLAYNTQFWAEQSLYKEFCYDASSTGDTEVYPRLDMLPGVREWIGARAVHNLTMESFSIKNRKFEETIAIPRTDVEDDRYGMFAPVASQMGSDAAALPDKLIAQLMMSGTTMLGYDGQYFFSNGHPGYTLTGGATTVSNTSGTGAYPGWYLVDRSKSLRPFIYQNRVPFELTTRFNPDDPSVFDNDEFLWGVRGRSNAGFGLWQLAYYSTLVLNPANLIAARTAMAEIRRPDGTPMGIRPDTLIVPSALFPRAMAYYKNTLIANDPSTPTTLVENDVINMFKPIEYTWLG